MLRLIKLRQLFTEIKKKKVAGSSHIYIIALFFIMFICFVFKMSLDRERIYVTYDMVDDTLVESLLSACTINREELAMGGHTVIYRRFTPERESLLIPGIGIPINPTPFDPLDNPDIFSPSGDAMLDKSYTAFMNTLKQNLKLDGSMNASISGINGVVSIDEFAIYNTYRSFDEDGNELGYRIVKYTRTPGGSWSCYPFNANTLVNIYNSVDHDYTTIGETCVSATISFDVVVADTSSYLTSLTADELSTHVTYSRIVDVKNTNP